MLKNQFNFRTSGSNRYPEVLATETGASEPVGEDLHRLAFHEISGRISRVTIETYRNLVIGSGEAGKYLAWNLAKMGQKTAVIERAMIGGSCPNVACLPSKNLIYSAKAVSLVDPDHGLGVVSGHTQVEMAGVARRKQAMVEELIKTHLKKFEATGTELIMGEARFLEPRTVHVTLNSGESRQLRGDRVFVCVGTRASVPDIPGLMNAGPMTHVGALNLDRLPQHLVILGGGYVGLEFAQALRRFGSKVTIIQRGGRLLEREDPEVSSALIELMRDEGIQVLLQTEVSSVAGHSGESVQLRLRTNQRETMLEATDILVATGRTPNTDRLDSGRAGIELDSRGFIRVNEKLETNAENIWAMGDCAGSPQFTHAGYDDFRVILSNLSGQHRTTTNRLIPYCLFTDPELARVGLNESEAKEKRIPYRIAQMAMGDVPRMKTLSQTRGFMKALIGEDDKILGFTAFGAEASEIMAVVQTAIVGGIPYTTLRDTIYAHPTATEGLVFLFSSGMVTAT